jgi:hypothetical protein
MTRLPDDFDAALAARFRQELEHLPPDPFVAVTARRIAVVRRRRTYLTHALQIAGVIAVILGSHWLIEASTIASSTLDAWFVTGIGWLVTPLGTIGVLIVGSCVLAALRWRSRGTGLLS